MMILLQTEHQNLIKVLYYSTNYANLHNAREFQLPKLYIIFEPEKIKLLRKTAVTLLSNDQNLHVWYKINVTDFKISMR